MSDEFNDWELSSGLTLDGAEVEVTKAEFGYNANFPGKLCANLTFSPTEGEDVEQSFTVGDGWDADRTGQHLVSSNGKQRKINERSNYGRLIASAVALIGIDNMAVTIGSSRDASNWVGTRWLMGTYTEMSTNPQTNAQKETTKYIFTKFLGKNGASAPAGNSGANAGESSSKPTTSSNSGSDDIPGELWDKLVALAKDSADHETFVEAALDVDGVEGNKAAQKACMGTGKGSVWAAR